MPVLTFNYHGFVQTGNEDFNKFLAATKRGLKRRVSGCRGAAGNNAADKRTANHPITLSTRTSETAVRKVLPSVEFGKKRKMRGRIRENMKIGWSNDIRPPKGEK